jgi:hypothetical protein
MNVYRANPVVNASAYIPFIHFTLLTNTDDACALDPECLFSRKKDSKHKVISSFHGMRILRGMQKAEAD